MFKYYKIASQEDLEDPTVYDDPDVNEDIDIFASIREIKSLATSMEEEPEDDDKMLYDESFEDD
jgi:hypothetical protein